MPPSGLPILMASFGPDKNHLKAYKRSSYVPWVFCFICVECAFISEEIVSDLVVSKIGLYKINTNQSVKERGLANYLDTPLYQPHTHTSVHPCTNPSKRSLQIISLISQ